jgi:hypothetical protein
MVVLCSVQRQMRNKATKKRRTRESAPLHVIPEVAPSVGNASQGLCVAVAVSPGHGVATDRVGRRYAIRI